MKKNLQAFRITILSLILLGFNYSASAQKDTIPPVIGHCGDTVKVQIGSVWVEQWTSISDNQSDSMSIVVKRTWNNSGPLNSLIRSIYSRSIEATDTNGNKAQCNIYYLVDDFIAPVINLNTSDTVCHKVNTPYTPVQPSVLDNFYPSNQVSIVRASSDIQANVLGVYYEEYVATDPSGNKGYKTRVVIVSANCLTSGISEVRNARFTMHPNPANSEFIVAPVVVGQANYVSIVAMDGKVVFASAFNEQLTIDSRLFASGVYSIRMVSGETLFVQKLVVQH